LDKQEIRSESPKSEESSTPRNFLRSFKNVLLVVSFVGSLFVSGDQLIASLPAEFESEEAQMETIRRLEQENEESVRRTAQLQQEAEELAKQVSAAVAFTATAQFQTLQSG
jgi:predicted PurR-regulated permease PerM